MIDEFLDDKNEYGIGDEWDSSYRSPVLSDNDKVYGSEAFAYYLSDYLFDDADYEKVDIDDVRVGDVIWLNEYGDDDEDLYGVATAVSSSKVTFLYAAYDYDEGVYYIDEDDRKFSSLGSRDVALTRYEDSSSNRGNLDENDVADLIDDFMADEYAVNAAWDKSSYTTELGNRYSGNRAFAYYMSDYIFGDEELTELDLDDIWTEDIQLGDLVRLYLEDDNNDDIYGVVIDTNDDDEEVRILYAAYDEDYDDYTIARMWVDFNDLDRVYTRY